MANVNLDGQQSSNKAVSNSVADKRTERTHHMFTTPKKKLNAEFQITETEEHIHSSTVATFLRPTNVTSWRDDTSDDSACRADHHYNQRGVVLWKQISRHGIHAIQRPELRIRGTRLVTTTVSEEKSNKHHVTTTSNGTKVEDTPSGNQRKMLHTNMKLLTKKDVSIQPQNHRTESDGAGGRQRRDLKKQTVSDARTQPQP